ncbi:hypothetical protein Theam_0125 [Thermovibrio ammonificans HB-1]|uniref:Uncharacterized protein n=1 Tax=Thermovibrio ammonificans (strain DSM 15698 / JCM 12110 / HB-1) TaxID=648996 RepID=E8T3G8_THEA1|nr:hypothetical protein [Thermovibrio ammonificans]ADU96099.1 hypothetical protein Theam_0125 [Thermovibrio ammonificans HB-1]
MGITLMLIILLIVVAIFLIKGSRKVATKRGVEVKGLDGSTLLFSEEGVSYFKNGEFTFLRHDQIESFSFEKKGGEIYEVVITGAGKEIRVPVRRADISRLFRTAHTGTVEPVFPWLGLILGTAAAVLGAELLGHALASELEQSHNQNDQPQEEDRDELQDFNLATPTEEFDYFDTGEWSDDDFV